jgi:ABC-type antimicrobial peptide transport system permease subunit
MLYDRVDTAQAQLFVLPSHPFASDDPPTGLVVRADKDGASLVPIVRGALQTLLPDTPFVSVDTVEALAAPQLQPWRLGTTMFMIFGGMALLMAAIGLYSSMAHAVSQRRQEIGIRMALGASRRHVVARIGLHGGVTVAVGIAIGLLISAGATRFLADLLYQTSPRDPLVFAAVAGVLAVAGVAAAIVPARRSASVNPLETLRSE